MNDNGHLQNSIKIPHCQWC